MKIKFLAVLFVVAATPLEVADADIIEVGDLNIIDDPGNPSNGLRYLDMSFSDGLSLADALTNAQGTYANARLATPSEFDDLFDASTLSLNGTSTFSSGFLTGANVRISGGANYNTSLRDQLGATAGANLFIWTDPDGSFRTNTTRDALLISFNNTQVMNLGTTAPSPDVGFLLVSEATATAVPEPSTVFLLGLGFAGSGALRRRRKQRRTRCSQQPDVAV